MGWRLAIFQKPHRCDCEGDCDEHRRRKGSRREWQRQPARTRGRTTNVDNHHDDDEQPRPRPRARAGPPPPRPHHDHRHDHDHQHATTTTKMTTTANRSRTSTTCTMFGDHTPNPKAGKNGPESLNLDESPNSSEVMGRLHVGPAAEGLWLPPWD